MTVYDVTRTLTPRTAVFPGDTPVTLTPTMQIAAGDACNVTAIAMSAHAGTHVDAPRHYGMTGAGVEAVPLDILIGPARLVTLVVHEIITVDDIRSALRVAHDALIAPSVVIVENLSLRDVPDGECELIALPLKIQDNDAALARVVLRR